MAFVNGAWPPFIYTHDIPINDGGPRRASVDDLGGNEHEDIDPAPEIGIEPTAAVTNEVNNHVAALERVGPLAKLWVQFIAGAPSIISVKAMGTQVNANSFIVTHPATGQTQIVWVTGTLAPQEADPDTCPSSQGGVYGKALTSPPTGKAGIMVYGWNTTTGAAADVDFIVEIN